ncbi:MAG TPA: NUDIX hydrolase [Alphaproteobacteria bacterium]|nr:NUDIX hydrolase [Alphaproteobacteria bacterium]HOO50003.1 NUDIX hydrolase [Alphaproteobacteria bacterium]
MVELIESFPSLKLVDTKQIRESQYIHHLSDCVILTKDGKILMQQRPENWGKSAGNLNIFGGHVEDGETVVQGLIRELHEELGAVVRQDDLVFIGAISEDWTNHTELVHVYFWHDTHGTITGCYEAEAREYNTVEEALAHPKIMDYAAWALEECRALKYI